MRRVAGGGVRPRQARLLSLARGWLSRIRIHPPALRTVVLAVVLTLGLGSVVPAEAQGGPAIVLAGGVLPGGYCQGVSILLIVDCVLLSCYNNVISHFRVAAEITLPSGPATLLVQQGYRCAAVYHFPAGSCAGGLQLDITCEGAAGTMFLGADGELRWKQPTWPGSEGGCCVTRSDLTADSLPPPG